MRKRRRNHSLHIAFAGKTTFIKYLLGRDYPGTHIGPEPTTDRFVVVGVGPRVGGGNPER